MERELHSDKALFSLISEGNEKAFEALFNRYVLKLIAFVHRMTQDRNVAESIVQETFLQIWLMRDQLDTVKHTSAWIYRIAANQCYKELRRKVMLEQSSETAAGNDLQETISLREVSRLVKEAVDRLSLQRRKVYQLSRDQGLTIPEIAARLQLSPNTVKNTLVSSLKAIREYLQERGYLLPTVLLLWLK